MIGRGSGSGAGQATRSHFHSAYDVVDSMSMCIKPLYDDQSGNSFPGSEISSSPQSDHTKKKNVLKMDRLPLARVLENPA
jgi:hypothetical protein